MRKTEKILLISSMFLFSFLGLSEEGPLCDSLTLFPTRKLLRNKRFSAEQIVDGWIGGIALTGWRTAFHPDKIFYDFFPDKSKQEREDLEKLIKKKQIKLQELKNHYEKISEEHEKHKEKEEAKYNALKIRYEKDLRGGFLGLNRKYRHAALKEICPHITVGKEYCKSYFN